MGVEAVLADQILDATTAGKAVLKAADASAQRTALGLGTLATQNGTISDYLTAATAASTYVTVSAAASAYQPLDGDLTAIAALATTSFGRSLLTQADAAATRSTIGAGTSSFDGVFSSLSGRPTTLTGYGITDALTAATAASTYLALSGGTLTGPVTFPASTASSANLNLPAGSAIPTSPVDGDMWYMSSQLNFRVSTVTRTVAWRNVNNSFSSLQTFLAGTAVNPSVIIPHGTNTTISSPSNGALWSHSSGWYVYTNGVTERLLPHASTQQTYTPASSGTATLLLSSTGSNLHKVTRPTTGNITIAFSGDTANQMWFLCLETSSTGTPGTVTWPAGITWLTNAGVAPTISTATNKVDSFVFQRTGSSTYLAWHTGQN